MSDKQKKADLILEKMDRMMAAFDDLSATVDEFHVRLKNLEDRKMDLNLEARLDTLESSLQDIKYETDKIDRLEDRVINIDGGNCTDYGDEISRLTEGVSVIANQLDEFDYERRSAERQRMLLEARAAMGKVRLVPIPVPM